MKLKADRKLIFLFLLCVILEIFVFNMNSFRVIEKNKYEKKSYTVDQMETTGFAVTGNILTYVPDYGQEPAIILKNVNTNVGTLYLDMYLPLQDYLQYEMEYTDEANQYLRQRVFGQYVPKAERTKWLTCHFSGETKELKIIFDIEEENYQMAIDACILNESVPFRFCIPRVLVLFVILSGCYVTRTYLYWIKPFKRRSQKVVLYALTGAFIGLMWLFYVNSVPDFEVSKERGDIYNELLTDALLAGEVKIDPDVSDALSALDDPYDPTERKEKGIRQDVDYIWDTAYYDGEFYVYFGVIPAILLFAPYKLLTGMYLSTGVATVLFLSVYIFFLNLLFVKCLYRFVPGTPFITYVLGMLVLDGGSLALHFAVRAKFYELAYASGLAFSVVGLYLLVNAYWKERWNYLQIFFGGFCLALAVGCRPTTVLYSFLLVPAMVKRLRESSIKEQLRPLLTLMAPYILVAVYLMWYNYARFGNPFDFGQNYQLTAINVGKEGYKLSTLPWCLWLGMFQPFHINAEFPFVYSGSNTTGFNGFFYNQAGTIPMFSAVPLLYLMFVPAVWRKWKEKQGSFATVMQGVLIGMGWIMAILTFLSAGVCIRYTAEAIPLFMFAVLLLVCNYIADYDGTIQKNLLTVFYAATLFIVLAAFLTGIVGETDRIFVNHKEFYYGIERAFCFWK